MILGDFIFQELTNHSFHKNKIVIRKPREQRPGLAFVGAGCTTTCIVMTDLGRSSNGALHCATVLPLSKILPAFISLMSLAVLGTIFLSEQQTDPKAQTPLLGLSRNKSVTNERFVKCRRVRL